MFCIVEKWNPICLIETNTISLYFTATLQARKGKKIILYYWNYIIFDEGELE